MFSNYHKHSTDQDNVQRKKDLGINYIQAKIEQQKIKQQKAQEYYMNLIKLKQTQIKKQELMEAYKETQELEMIMKQKREQKKKEQKEKEFQLLREKIREQLRLNKEKEDKYKEELKQKQLTSFVNQLHHNGEQRLIDGISDHYDKKKIKEQVQTHHQRIKSEPHSQQRHQITTFRHNEVDSEHPLLPNAKFNKNAEHTNILDKQSLRTSFYNMTTQKNSQLSQTTRKHTNNVQQKHSSDKQAYPQIFSEDASPVIQNRKISQVSSFDHYQTIQNKRMSQMQVESSSEPHYQGINIISKNKASGNFKQPRESTISTMKEYLDDEISQSSFQVNTSAVNTNLYSYQATVAKLPKNSPFKDQQSPRQKGKDAVSEEIGSPQLKLKKQMSKKSNQSINESKNKNDQNTSGILELKDLKLDQDYKSLPFYINKRGQLVIKNYNLSADLKGLLEGQRQMFEQIFKEYKKMHGIKDKTESQDNQSEDEDDEDEAEKDKSPQERSKNPKYASNYEDSDEDDGEKVKLSTQRQEKPGKNQPSQVKKGADKMGKARQKQVTKSSKNKDTEVRKSLNASRILSKSPNGQHALLMELYKFYMSQRDQGNAEFMAKFSAKDTDNFEQLMSKVLYLKDKNRQYQVAASRNQDYKQMNQQGKQLNTEVNLQLNVKKQLNASVILPEIGPMRSVVNKNSNHATSYVHSVSPRQQYGNMMGHEQESTIEQQNSFNLQNSQRRHKNSVVKQEYSTHSSYKFDSPPKFSNMMAGAQPTRKFKEDENELHAQIRAIRKTREQRQKFHSINLTSDQSQKQREKSPEDMSQELLRHVRRMEYYKRRVKPDFAPVVPDNNVSRDEDDKQEWNKYFSYKV